MTLGEGGIVVANSSKLNRVLKSLRDWGRDCFCATDEKSLFGKCGQRFDYKLGNVNYDHIYNQT